MWTIIKVDKKKLGFLKSDFTKILGNGMEIYSPTFLVEKVEKNKSIKKKFKLFGDYFFCYHKNLSDIGTINSLRFTRGLKYFLNGFQSSQSEIEEFILKCKNSENKRGYLTQNFFDLNIKKQYIFKNGPFKENIFKIINLHKDNIRILLGNFKTSIKKKDYLFLPV